MSLLVIAGAVVAAVASAATMAICYFGIPAAFRWAYKKYFNWRYRSVEITADSNTTAFSTLIALTSDKFQNSNAESLNLFANSKQSYLFAPIGKTFSIEYKNTKIFINRNEKYKLILYCSNATSNNAILNQFIGRITQIDLRNCNTKAESIAAVQTIKQYVQ